MRAGTDAEIQTPRLRLRPPSERDLPGIVAGCGDPLVAQFIPAIPEPYTLDDARAFLTYARAPGDERVFAIEEVKTRSFCGTIAVRLFEGGSVGYWLVPEARGRGITAEAARALVAWAHARGIRKLTLTAHPDNVASQRVAEKVGFVPIGLVPHDPPFRDGTTEAVGFELDTYAPTPRLAARVRRDFGAGADAVLARLTRLRLALAEKQSRERIQAAVVLLGAGDGEALERAAELAERDWRDVLVAADLAQPEWPRRLDAELGSVA